MQKEGLKTGKELTFGAATTFKELNRDVPLTGEIRCLEELPDSILVFPSFEQQYGSRLFKSRKFKTEIANLLNDKIRRRGTPFGKHDVAAHARMRAVKEKRLNEGGQKRTPLFRVGMLK